eukprot:g43090.t1
MQELTKSWKSRIEYLEKEVLDLESCLSQSDVDPAPQEMYEKKKAVLRDLHLVGSWDVYMGSWVQFLWDLDHGSSSFYSLEKRHRICQRLLVPLIDEGSLISDAEDTRAQVWDLRTALFSLDLSSNKAHKMSILNIPLSLDELTGALNQLSRSKSLGLSREYLRTFWNELGEPLLRNSFLLQCGFHRPRAENVRDAGLTRLRDTLNDGGANWMILVQVAKRALVNTEFTNCATHSLRDEVLSPNTSRETKVAQVCCVLLDELTPFHPEIDISLWTGPSPVTQRATFCAGLLLKVWLHFSHMYLIYRHPVWGGMNKSQDLLVVLHLGLAKVASPDPGSGPRRSSKELRELFMKELRKLYSVWNLTLSLSRECLM